MFVPFHKSVARFSVLFFIFAIGILAAQPTSEEKVANLQITNAASIPPLEIRSNGSVDYSNLAQGSKTQDCTTKVLNPKIEIVPPGKLQGFVQSLKFVAGASYAWVVIGDFQPFTKENFDPRTPGFSISKDGKSLVRAIIKTFPVTGTSAERFVFVLNGMVDSTLQYQSTTGKEGGKLNYAESGTFLCREPWVRLNVRGKDFSRLLNFRFDRQDRAILLTYYRSAPEGAPQFVVSRLRTLASSQEVNSGEDSATASSEE